MKFLVRTFMSWLPLAVAITGICLLVYTTVQQNYRQSLNDPQIQMAEDAANVLYNNGGVIGAVVPNEKIDITKSLQPWIAVYDNGGKVLKSSGVYLGGGGLLPQPPQGVFSSVGKDAKPLNFGQQFYTSDVLSSRENRVTWQPDVAVRQAIVVVRIEGSSGGFVVAGRNMREVENREGNLSTFVLLAWITLLVATFATKAFAKYFA